jgi:hypothetical protein
MLQQRNSNSDAGSSSLMALMPLVMVTAHTTSQQNDYGSDVMLWLWCMVMSSSWHQQLCGVCSVCYGYGFSTSMNTNKYEKAEAN